MSESSGRRSDQYKKKKEHGHQQYEETLLLLLQNLLLFRSSRSRCINIHITSCENSFDVMTIITGTTGIGKTMFALYLARIFFSYDKPVLLYYEDQFWAFANHETEFLPKKYSMKGGDRILLSTIRMEMPMRTMKHYFT